MTREEKMEEETCHGETMGQINDIFEVDILSEDKSLKGDVFK
jgi:hypothetical protein